MTIFLQNVVVLRMLIIIADLQNVVLIVVVVRESQYLRIDSYSTECFASLYLQNSRLIVILQKRIVPFVSLVADPKQ